MVRYRIFLIVAFVLAAGCGQETDVPAAVEMERVGDAPAASDGMNSSAPPVPVQRTMPSAKVVGSTTVGGLPDTGGLVAFGAPPSRAADGRQWHPVAVSEAHALRAIETGVLRVRTPSGEELAYEYEEHQELDTGEWAWVGNLRGDERGAAVLAFGDGAVFGRLEQPGARPALEVTTRGSGAYMVAQVAGERSAAALPRGDRAAPEDILLPPAKRYVLPMEGTGAAPAAASAPVSATAAATATSLEERTIDIVAGYTPGYVETFPPADAIARTRILRNIVEASKIVFQRLPEPARLRVMRIMPVPHVHDAATDHDLLEAMTGYDAESEQFVAPAPAFTELRAARHKLGADLVILFRRPSPDPDEHEACGAAWLIGGDGTGIDPVADEAFGYSVVCRPPPNLSVSNLMRQLQRNFGLEQHDSSKLNDAVPLVASFRSPTIDPEAPSQDVNGDGTEDLPWFKQGRMEFWHMDRQSIIGTAAYLVKGDLRPQAMGDLNFDNVADIIWRDGTGRLVFWLSGPPYMRAAREYAIGNEWQLLATGDQDGDSYSDLIWRHASDGRVMYWLMGPGLEVVATREFQFDPEFPVIFAADLDGNRTVDLFTRRRADGALRIWRANEEGFVDNLHEQRMSKYWVPVGIDPSDTGLKRIYWRSAFDDRIVVWWLSLHGRPPSLFSPGEAYSFDAPAGRSFLGAKDVDGNGYLDILWRRDDGAVSVWLGQFDHTFVNRYVGLRDTSWQLFHGGL